MSHAPVSGDVPRPRGALRLDATRSSSHDQAMSWWMAAGCVLLACMAPGAGDGAQVSLSACRMSQFAVKFGPLVSEATGQHTITLRLVNRERRACVLEGFPRIQADDRAGRIPFVIRRAGDQMVTSRRPRRFVVPPGRAAFVALNHYRCDLGDLRTATSVRIGTRAIPAEMAGIRTTDRYQRLDYCGKSDPGSTLAVSPFEPTFRATLRH